MASKTVELQGIGPITLYKRKGARHIRLSIGANGKVRVSLPFWAPYTAGIAFAQQKSDWLRQQAKPKTVLLHGTPIGKSHTITFEHSDQLRVTTRVTQEVIKVKVPLRINMSDDAVQTAAQRACVRALKQEAETLLPSRLRQLADTHGFDFRSVEVKRLKSRWGSCNSQHEIVLNCFLMQLPWHLIDYVLLHELVHTRIMAHGPRFWSCLSQYTTHLAATRKEIRSYQPVLQSPQN